MINPRTYTPRSWAGVVLPLACVLILAACSSGTSSQNGVAASDNAVGTTQPSSTSASASGQPSPAASQGKSASEVPPTEPGDCTPGQTKINGVDAVQHCGPASGEFTVGDTTVKVAPGKCEISMGAWVINVGATVVDPAAGKEKRSQVSYLGIVAGKPGGTATAGPDLSKVQPSDVVVAFTGGGIADSITSGKAKVHFAADGQSGTFSGPTFSGSTVTGKFDCGK